MATLTHLSEHCRVETQNNLERVANQFGLVVPGSASTEAIVDIAKVEFLTKLAEKSSLHLPDFVRLVRGQTPEDPRPNKDLYELPMPPKPELHETWQRWNKVVAHGVIPEWHPHPIRQRARPRNHRTIDDHETQVWRHIRKGQDEGRYLVVKSSLLERWNEIFLSPVGVVDKEGADGPDIRIIDDYSFPEGDSVNDFTDRCHLPEVHYNPPRDIAQRISDLRNAYPGERINIMLGDVAGAFRHVPIHADHMHMFAFCIGDLLVIDMFCGFGWCGSPAWYSLPGSLINGFYEKGLPAFAVAPPFGGMCWCDDHTCVERDIELRCCAANLSLRRAMATVLGPSAINERKFTPWGESGRALGLLWDTKQGTVTIPLEKIKTAKERVSALLQARVASKTTLLQVIGSLRHVMTCCPPARAFYQRLQDRATAMRRSGIQYLTEHAVADLQWLKAILLQPERFNRIPVSYFANSAAPALHVYMDASDDGLCALEPTLRQYIRVRFPQATRDELATSSSSVDSINVREMQSAVLAALLWGPIWAQSYPQKPVHVWFWIDNTSAVSWVRRRASRNPRAQLYNRLLSLAEFQNSLAFNSRHIPGVENVMADAGSRAWSVDHPLHAIWSNLSAGWMQVPVQAPFDDLCQLWETCSAGNPLPNRLPTSITSTGSNGADFQQ